MIDYIIVQAGGKGTRLEHLTKNKPKALVPIENLPMIFHLFRKFPDKKYIIIGDYKKEVFREYLRSFSTVEYIFVEAEGTGTCGGLKQAIRYIPDKKSFMYLWSDLILSKNFELPEDNNNHLGISYDFECRWSYQNKTFLEEKSKEYGVAGLFVFNDKSAVSDVPDSGEFVRYLSTKNIEFEELRLTGTREYGLLSEYNKLKVEKCRPFNSMKIEDSYIIKEGIDKQGLDLAEREVLWYKKAKELGYKRIPEIYEYTPLKMQLINGKNIYEYEDLQEENKREVVKKLVRNLWELHELDSVPSDMFSVQDAYVNKTFGRLSKIKDLVPYANEKYININGRKCRNVFYYREELERQIMSYEYEDFKFIHGDCTFSNMMLDENEEPVLIDPRGYFGSTQLYGDADYDWAKLYYSLKGNYDSFNLKNFRLTYTDEGVEVNIKSNGFESIADDIFSLVPQLDEKKIKLLHAIIWLSLTTYAWQDYDSVCGAFYVGCYYLEEVLDD